MYKFRVTDLDENKEISVILKSIYGIGWHKSSYILSLIGISSPSFLDNLNSFYKDILFFYLESFVLTIAKIDRYTDLRIKKLIDLNTYKGVRHNLNLPVHGQRTRTNANTQRSKRRKLEELLKH